MTLRNNFISAIIPTYFWFIHYPNIILLHGIADVRVCAFAFAHPPLCGIMHEIQVDYETKFGTLTMHVNNYGTNYIAMIQIWMKDDLLSDCGCNIKPEFLRQGMTMLGFAFGVGATTRAD
jgi:hypothetical protein